MASSSGHTNGRQDGNEDNDQNDDQETRSCIICMEGEEDGELITPCDCKGRSGLQYYHYHCLREWMLRNNDDPCAQCGQRYTDRRIRRRHLNFFHWLMSIRGFIFTTLFAIFFMFFVMLEWHMHSKFWSRRAVRRMRLRYFYMILSFIALPFLGGLAFIVFAGIGSFQDWRRPHRLGFVDFIVNLANGRRHIETLDVTFAEQINRELAQLEFERAMFEQEMQEYNERWDEFADNVRKNLPPDTSSSSSSTSSDEDIDYKTADEDSDADYADATDRSIVDDYQVIIETLNGLMVQLEQWDLVRHITLRSMESDVNIADLGITLLERSEEERRAVREVLEDMLNQLNEE